MNPRAIPYVKEAMRRFDQERAGQIAAEALRLPSAADVRSFLARFSE
jgi:signal transduction protein with GAF and PtsI domain